MGKRLPVRGRIGLGLILVGAAIYGGWAWWMATRTWVPLDMPVSLARGHVRSPEFKINVAARFWIYIEVELKPDEEGVPCLIGYNSDYCRKHGVHELRASWTLSDAGKVVAQGSTDKFQAVRGGMVTRARGLGEIAVPTRGHYVLDIDFPDDNSRFDAGQPRVIAQNWDWRYEEERQLIFLVATFLGAIGAGLLVSAITGPIAKRRNEIISLTAPGPQPSGQRIEAAGHEVESASDGTRFPCALWLGLALVLVAVILFVAVRYWYNTRIFEAVNVPVSLAAGHIRTGPFRLNIEGDYSIFIDLDENSYFDPACSAYSRLQTRWVLYRDGSVADRWDEPVLHDTYLEGFQATKGTYDLDIEILADASCLNANRPRLRVLTSETDYEFYATVVEWPAGLCVTVGAGLLVLVWFGRFANSPVRTATITSAETVGQNFQWAQKLPLRRPISGLPSFGWAAATTFAVLAMVMMVLEIPMTPKGLQVHLLRPGAVPTKSDTWTEPLIVWVKDAGLGHRPNLYVNSKPVAREDLDRVLKQELGRRRDWVVYIGGDDAVAWQDVADVIDVARGDQAKVYLTTSPPSGFAH